jgi:heme-degrading monooxygenase HmoA
MADCLIVTMTFSVKPEASAKLGELLPSMLEETRQHTGFIAIRALRNKADPHKIIMIQEWKSAADYQAYVVWRSADGRGAGELQRCSRGLPRWRCGIVRSTSVAHPGDRRCPTPAAGCATA